MPEENIQPEDTQPQDTQPQDTQPQDTQPQDIQPDVTEVLTLGFEWMKQLTTLSAGSIVVIGTFLSNIFPTDEQGTLTVPWYTELLIGAAFVSFGVSLIVSAKAMNTYRAILEGFRHGEGPEKLYTRTRELTISWPLRAFTAGVICFGVAVLLNLGLDSVISHLITTLVTAL